ncbi:hypothetical protein ACFLRQ_01290 [Bacteroidota bacterium]
MKHLLLILTTLALITLNACNTKEKEAAIAVAEKATALENASAEFFSTVGSFDYDILTNVNENAGKNFMMYQLPAKTLIGVEYGELTYEAQLTKDVVVKKLPGANAFFKGNHRITKWKPYPVGYGVEYHVWPGKIVSADWLVNYPNDKLVKGGIYDGWLRVESIAHLLEWMEPAKKVAMVGIMPLYYVHVYEYKGETKGALKSRHLLFADGVR